MKTEDLIATLTADAAPVPKAALSMRLGLACGLGAALALLLLLAWLGLRPDLMQAIHTRPFWMKAGYTLWLAVGGLMLVARLGRPGGRAGGANLIILTALLLILGMGGLDLATAGADQRMAHWLGDTWRVCPFRILVISTPAFAAISWGLKRLAPTRLGLAGAGAGLLAGAIGATVYGLYCAEDTAAFVATWYTLGVAACTAIGALLGPRLLRW